MQASGLTKREREVAAFVAEGLTNRDIADRLVISDRTVETHVEHIRNKLGVRSRAQVATWSVTGGELDVRKDTVLAGPFSALGRQSVLRGSEHRVVTCLFADVAPSTDVAARLGPERTKTVIDRALQELSAIATAEGAVVEKSTGGAYFAMFGAPVTHADDPTRALRAAESAMRWGKEHPDTTVRIGVETGEVLVDLDAIATTGDGMAFGACISVAGRMRNEAAPGEVLVGPVCREATSSTAAFVGRGQRDLEGVGSIAIAALVRAETGLAARPPFVGRRREFELLRAALERARSGDAIFSLLIAPPGQGKTRTAEEFISALGGKAHVLRARCRPGAELGAQTPLHQLLTGDLGQPTVEAINARSRAVVADAGLRADTVAAIAHSAGVLVDQRLLSLSPAERLEALSHAWRRYLGGLAANRPVVIWIDDLHWADPQLVRLLDRITSGSGVALLVIGAARPEFVDAGLRPGRDRVHIDIGPLDEADAASLAVSAGAIDERATLRGEGNPLFVIELARAHAGERDDIPVTVQAAIGARLDELQAADRDLLQHASVVGEMFDAREVALLGGREVTAVATSLARLVQLRYLRPIEGSFRFHHPLVHEVVYHRLTLTDRMRLHARFARNGVDKADVAALAHHWWEALRPPDGDWVWEDAPDVLEMRREAIDAHIAAGQRFADQDSHERAVEFLDRAISLAKLPADRGRAEHALASAYWRFSMGDEAWMHRLRAIAAYRLSGQAAPAALYADAIELTLFQYGYFRVLPDIAVVRGLLKEGLDAARAAGDAISLARLLVQHGHLVGDAESVDEALEIVRTSKDPRVHTDALQRLGIVKRWSGDIAGALDVYRRVDELAAQGGWVNEIEMLWWRGLASYDAGELSEVEQLSERFTALAARRSAHLRSHALALVAHVRLARGDWEGLARLGGEIGELVSANPSTQFCLAAGSAVAYASVADSVRGRTSPLDLDELVLRMVPESAAVRDSIRVLPMAMAGRDCGALSTAAFERSDAVWDREALDAFGLRLVMALVVQERWSDLEASLVRLDRAAAHGSALARAVATAARGEMGGGSRTRETAHHELRTL
ncbi:MAG TPA: AAA family ATPase, partial [Candidatus Polarisedimenticolia bacterium]|nr:AAA family ATPase [Candidatus Polarisedimenticolia bacterium]